MAKVSLCTGSEAHYTHTDELGLREIVGFRRDYAGWFVRVKRDGVLAVWLPEENRLMSRSGGTYRAPQEWLDRLPPVALQGELVYKVEKDVNRDVHDDFNKMSGIARRNTPKMEHWQNVDLAVFDLFEGAGSYRARCSRLTQILEQYPDAPAYEIPLFVVESNEWLVDFANTKMREGMEGVVLYDPEARYRKGKTGTMRKVKAKHRAEARVLKHLPGGGRLAEKELMGKYYCVLVSNPKIRFRCGSGMSDEQRANPVPVGGIITVEYMDTNKGKPRMPIFKGERNPEDMD